MDRMFNRDDVLDKIKFLENSGSTAVSPAGALGRYQLMPQIIKAYGIQDPTDDTQSRFGAGKLVDEIAQRAISKNPNIAPDHLEKVILAGYNGGIAAENAVMAGKAPPSNETRKYLNRVSTYGGAQQQVQSVDLGAYSQKYANQIEAARQQGFSDQEILKNIRADEAQAVDYSKAQAEALPKISRDIKLTLAQQGDTDQAIAMLRQVPGLSKEIDFAKTQKFTNEEILKNLAPDSVKGLEAYKKRQGVSFFGNAADGATNQMADYWLGAKQLVSTGDTNQQLLNEEAQRRIDPERLALNSTVGGKVGSVIPDVVAGLATGGTGLEATVARRAILAAGTGAATGALNPIVEGESRLANAATGAALSGAAQLGIDGAIKGVRRLSGSTFVNPQNAMNVVDEAKARIISKKIADDVGYALPNDTPLLDNKWIQTAKNGIEGEYDSLLKGKYATSIYDSDVYDKLAKLSTNETLDKEFKDQIVRLFEITPGDTGITITRKNSEIGEASLRELHDLQKNTNNYLYGLHQDRTLNPYKKKAYTELADVLDTAFSRSLDDFPEQHVLMRQAKLMGISKDKLLQIASKDSKITAKLEELIAHDRPQLEKIRGNLEDINNRYGKFKVAEDLYLKTGGDIASELTNPAKWDAAIANRKYKSRFTVGTAPLQDVHSAVQADSNAVKSQLEKASSARDTGNLVATGMGLATQSPLVYSAVGGAGRLVSRLQKARAAKLSDEIVNLVGKQESDKILKSVQDGLPVSAERRLSKGKGDKRKTDSRMLDALKLARRGVIINQDE